MTNHRRRNIEETPTSKRDFSVTLANWITASIIALVPFQGFLTVYGAHLGANYTLLRIWDDIALVVLLAICTVWYIGDAALRERLKNSYVALVVVVFAVVQLCFTIRGAALGTVGPVAALMGLALNLRGPLFLLVGIIVMKYSAWPIGRWLRIALSSAIIVAAFGVLQLTVLPKDFLTHFGYSSATILPYETINSNESYVRFASTTRGVNPLGAYMAMMIAIVIALWTKLRPKLTWAIVTALLLGAMVASFSRSAWIGCAISLACIVALRLKTRKDWLWAGGIVVVASVVVGVLFASLAGNMTLQNVLLHTDKSSSIKEDSNDARYSAFFTTVREITHDPLGKGVGSAGPASIHNTQAAPRMAENYFLQITQETGWFGLFVYLALIGIIGMQLWKLRDEKIALGLFAALAGTVAINMLSFAWTDDTLAFTWYGLAGLVLGLWVWRQNDVHAIVTE